MENFTNVVPGLICGIILIIPGAMIGASLAELQKPENHSGGYISLLAAFRNAHRLTDWRVWHRLKNLFGSTRTSTAPRDDDSWWVKPLLGFLAGAVAVGFYATIAPRLALALVFVATAVFVASLFAFWVFWKRGITDGRDAARRLIFGIVLIMVGVFSAIQMVHPILYPDALPTIRAAVEGANRASGLVPSYVEGVLKSGDSGWELFYQLVGALATLAMLLAFIGFSIASVLAIYLKNGTKGAWLWKFGYWVVRWSVSSRTWWTLTIVGIIGALLTSGVAYFGISQLAHLTEHTNSPAPTPTTTP